MTAQPTRLEAGHNHVLAYCRECPSWRRLAGDKPEAKRRAAEHLALVHGMATAARQLRYEAAQADTPTRRDIPNPG